ncbi:hypothetical protein [Schleiferia thermophila]|jgi:hypothetical protein|uniref:hypothetical protein n=1 Tax=Schleiferia thermophila TaxID=884107 RepID=UPI0004E76130|nr:hypothetical protein [Schleiferia thermophila]KFD39644.1 hypothetical protein AT05_02920 [Schleiferia thermophila str. Yellowstone]PMB29356.1 hypothetical protein CEN47_13175 [Fischerella thermalis CCMEE 5319]
MRKIFVLLLILIFSVILAESSFAQCAMCKAVAESSSGNIGAKNLNTGILFLMSIPYLLATVIAIAIWRHNRQTKNTSSAKEP